MKLTHHLLSALFCSLRLPDDTYAWIGLTVARGDCDSSGTNCTRAGWEWDDGTPLRYPGDYHDWKDKAGGDNTDEPGREERCATISFDGWDGRNCPSDDHKISIHM